MRVSHLGLLAAGSLAFRVHDVPVNRTYRYQTTWNRNRLDDIPGLPPHEHALTFPGSLLIQSPRPKGAILNGLVEAVHYASADHHPLRLTPEVIYFAVLQGIVDMRPGHPFIQNSFIPPNRNHRVSSMFGGWKDGDEWYTIVGGLKSYHQGKMHRAVYKEIAAEFTHSDPSITGLFPLMLKSHGPLSVNPKTTQYASLAMPAAGEVPEIELTGTLDDWQQVRDRATALLDRLKLQSWAGKLIPVLDQFVTAKQGNPNVTFWKAIYKRQPACESSLVSGWINVFFPTYLTKDGSAFNHCLENSATTCPGHPIGSYPVMALDYPFDLGHFVSSYPANLVMAIYGAKASGQFNNIQPVVAWSMFYGDSQRIPYTNEMPALFEHSFEFGYHYENK